MLLLFFSFKLKGNIYFLLRWTNGQCTPKESVENKELRQLKQPILICIFNFICMLLVPMMALNIWSFDKKSCDIIGGKGFSFWKRKCKSSRFTEDVRSWSLYAGLSDEYPNFAVFFRIVWKTGLNFWLIIYLVDILVMGSS